MYRVLNSRLTLPVLAIIVLFGVSCNRNKVKDKVDFPNDNKALDTIKKLEEQEPEPEPELIVNYKIDSLATSAMIDSFYTKYTYKERKIIFAINRIDPTRISVNTKLVIPDTLVEDLIEYSPFPKKMEILNTIPKTILIAQRIQGIALYENGKLVKWGPISSGKQSTPTPNGLHYGNYKSREKISTVDEAWKLPFYFNFMNFEGVGVHQYSLPGYPASHACVRLYKDDAKYIYDWAKQWELNSNGRKIIKKGTPFMVFGAYDYKSEAPWFKLAKNRLNNDINNDEMATLKDYVAKYTEYIKTIDSSNLGTELSLEEGAIVTYN